MVIRIAIVGAGNFAREGHLPAIRASAVFELVAVYSYSQTNAEAFAARNGIDAFFDRPETTARKLDDLLQRPDIEAVTIALPIGVQPSIVRRALRAGKSVLSEKPIANDVETAEALLAWYNSSVIGPNIWSVGESFRFWEPVIFAYQQLRDLKSNVLTFNLKVHNLVRHDDKILKSTWRRSPQCPGGFILDAGVHYVAALRMLLAASGETISRVTAFTTLLEPNLAPKDTANATFRLSNGRSGTFNFSYGTDFATAFDIQVVTDGGVVSIEDHCVKVVKDGESEDMEQVTTTRFPVDHSLGREIEVFAQGILKKTVEVRGSPQEALEDLKVIEAILRSGDEGGAVKIIS